METVEQHSSATAFRLKDLLLAPLGCLLSIPPYLVLGATLAVVFGGLIVYNSMNINLFGFGAPNFKEYVIDKNFTQLRWNDRTWLFQYEKYQQAAFVGKVRHVSPIREEMLPVLTHDILVTSGDYADPEKVNTSVSNHHFFWQSRSASRPAGAINLLHTVPISEEIYHQLMTVRKDQQVKITGYEILKIDVQDQTGKLLGTWQDTGCNSLLVTSVTIQPQR